MHRRALFQAGLAAGAAALLPTPSHAAEPLMGDVVVDVLRVPDLVSARFAPADLRPLARTGSRWSLGATLVEIDPRQGAHSPEVAVYVQAAPGLTFLHLRWEGRTTQRLLTLGDAWERSYGDLEWRATTPERPMPWYCLTTDGNTVVGYGVQTGASALCFWQRDPDGLSLTLDLRNGGEPAELATRRLHACTVVSLRGRAEEPIHSVATRFCQAMCPAPRLPAAPIFGSNDWNYAYGQNTGAGILRDTDLVASLAAASPHRPFVVIDDGYQDPKRFPDMAGLAAEIRKRAAKPGLWIRPLRAPRDTAPSLLLPAARFGGTADQGPAYDPTLPEALALVTAAVQTPAGWGYELLKHDFTTWELFGRWGSHMGASVTGPGWHFHDRSRTNAEIVSGLYRAIREAAGEQTLILGCNTIGHLAAGLFESQRIGDDTSGLAWERTRRTGVNTLAQRIAQHKTFSYIDPDIVAITPHIPWGKTRQWLDVVARTGTSLFIAPDPLAMDPAAQAAVREAFTLVQATAGGYPDNPTSSLVPNDWVFPNGTPQTYDWVGPGGADPFLSV